MSSKKLDFSNLRVLEIRQGGQLVLLFGPPDHELHLTGDFTLHGAHDVAVKPFDPPYPKQFLELVGEKVRRLAVDSNGSTIIEFNGGQTIDIPPSEDFEAWELTGPNGLRWVLGPSGKLTTWTPPAAG